MERLDETAAFCSTQFVRASSQSWIMLSSRQRGLKRCDRSPHVRLAGLVSVICVSCLSGSHRSVVNKLEQVLAVPGYDGELFAMLAEGIELVGEGGLQFLTSDVGKLSLSNKRFSLGSDKFLLEHDNARRVGFLVFELSNLISDLLLACDMFGNG